MISYHNASYFDGRILPAFEGNLEVKHEAAKQNYSSVCSYLCNRNIWNFLEQITELCAHQQELIR
jgi:hypothetical protein